MGVVFIVKQHVIQAENVHRQEHVLKICSLHVEFHLPKSLGLNIVGNIWENNARTQLNIYYKGLVVAVESLSLRE